MWARSYLWASTCHETHTATDRVVWVHNCGDKRCTRQQFLMIVMPGRIHTLLMGSNVSERSATRGRQVSDSRLTPTKMHTVARNWPQLHICLLKHLSCFPNFATPCQPPFKNSCKGHQNEARHCFAAELWPVSNSLVVKMEFCKKLEGRRMVPYLERECIIE